jgi:SAM-dependent methyltransferase
MRPRVQLGLFLFKLGRFVSSLPLMVMRPDDIMAFSRQKYAKPQTVDFWGNDGMVAGGLTPLEDRVLAQTGLVRGKALVLGLGGGREAIPLARRGLDVTGMDYIPAAAAMARANAARHGVELDARVGDYLASAPLPAGYDLAMFTSRMYSSIPSRTKRLSLLKKICEALQPGGWFICGFCWNPAPGLSPQVERLRRLCAYLSLGNLWYEPGDMLGGYEFIHAFGDRTGLMAEFAEGGFALAHLHIPAGKEDTHGMALLQKPH